MKLGSFEWRAMALPAAVVVGSFGILLWFSLVRVPAVEQYLHQANLRILRTISAQLKTKVDGVQGNIDLALKAAGEGDVSRRAIGAFVQKYTGDLEILCPAAENGCSSDLERRLLEAAGDPPVAQLDWGSGHPHLYLAYKPKLAVVARIDLGKVFADNLPADREFDALLLADTAGRVIVQHSAEGLDVSRADRMPLDPEGTPKGGDPKDAGQPRYASLRDAAPGTRVALGGRSYQLYVQTVTLAMQRLKVGTTEPGEMEEWTLCGLVASDRIRAASTAVSYDFIIWFGALVIALCAAIPLLKLRVLHPHERLTRSDAVLVSASIFVEVALVSLVLLDMHQFGWRMPQIVEAELNRVADDLLDTFRRETRAVDAQMTAYDVELQALLAGKDAARPGMDLAKGVCVPEWACRAVLAEPHADIAGMPYPFFDLVTWVDGDGNQRVKRATSAGVTPFINLRESRLAYFEDLSLAKRLNDEVDDNGVSVAKRLGTTVHRTGVSVLVSPTTGKRLTVFWKALPHRRHAGSALGILTGQSLATNPLSLDQPQLPADIGFAVVNRDGLVLFHSDHTRSMKENFIEESENDLPLRTLLEHRQPGSLHVTYRARDQQILVRPFDLDTPDQKSSFASPDWSLIVFQDHNLPDTLNLYTLVVAGSLFIGYAIILVLGLAVAALLVRPRVLAWLWPDRRRAETYWTITAINVAVAVLCVLGTYVFAPPPALVLTGLGIPFVLAANFVLGTRETAPTDRRRESRGARTLRHQWLPAFLSARATLIFVLAAVPALASVRTATDIEQRIFMIREARQQENGVRARLLRLQSRVPIKGICPGPAEDDQCERKTTAYEGRLQGAAAGWFEPSSPQGSDPWPGLFPAQRGEVATDGVWSSALAKGFLSRAHPPVNDIGVGLAAVLAGADPRYARPSLAWLAVLPILGLLAFALVRYAAARMLVLDLDAGRATAIGTGTMVSGHSLILAPPGADTYVEWRHLGDARHVDLRLPGAAEVLVGPETSSMVVLHHLEAGLVDGQLRQTLLHQLEVVVYQGGRTVWLVSNQEPVRFLEAVLTMDAKRGDAGTLAGRLEVERWIRLLQSFRCEFADMTAGNLSSSVADATAADPVERAIERESVRCPAIKPLVDSLRLRLSGQGLSAADWWRALDDMAEPCYRSIWTACSTEERLVLRQLVEEGLVNPCDQTILLSLMQKGLLVRDPAFRLMNVSFARFVARAVPARTIKEWEHQVAGTPWSSVRTALITSTLAGAGFVAFTQQQLFSAWFGMALPTLAPALLLPLLRDAVGKMIARRLTAASDVKV